MGVIDASVHTHNCHSPQFDDPTSAMEGTIRFMIAVTRRTPMRASPFHLTGRPLVVLHQKFRLPGCQCLMSESSKLSNHNA